MRQFIRRRIRLPLDRYGDPGSVWHVTITTFDRLPVLSDREFALAVVDCLKNCCERVKSPLLMYCVLPDHIHALVQVDETSLIKVIHDFKSYRTRVFWKHCGQRKLWQRSAYDRGVRKPEAMDNLLGYIFHNPGEGELVERAFSLGLIGGTLVDE